MDEITEPTLIRAAVARWCGDCGTETLFLPVEPSGWCCTSCDAAISLPAA